MNREEFDQLREKDHTVLHCIENGENDTRKIRESTTLSNRDVNYALDKLEELGLIETQTPDGRVTEVVDGQKRNFKAPRQAFLNDLGQEHLDRTDLERIKYQDISREELIARVHELEQEVEALQDSFEVFRRQVLQKFE